jgi:hypothetical protein
MVTISWTCRPLGALLWVAALAIAPANLVSPASAAEHGGGGGAPPPVNTNINPDALILNTKNPLAVHAGPGKPNVGSVYLPPSLSGKDKKAKSGQTEEKVMGATPAH